jgi:hypothetical protein
MLLGRQQHRSDPTHTSEDLMYTIRRTSTIVAVVAGLAVASAGLASAADGGPTATAPVTTTAAAPRTPLDSTSSAADAASGTAGSTTVRVDTQSSTSASAEIDGSAPNVPLGNDATDGAWCASYRLAVAIGGDSWFGSVHIKGLCEQPQS